jgi:para-nitrobenzyl esterase
MISHTKRTFLKGSLTLGAAACMPRLFALPDGVTPPVRTTAGQVRGYVEEGVNQFKGIRYAAPPVGNLRFAPPQKPTPWNGVAETLNYGNSAMQLASGGGAVSYPGKVGPALNQVFGSSRDRLMQSEDCLFLNVWTPGLDNAGRPVMVWFHGGGHNYGSGTWPAYDGHNMARDHNVVLVTVNHRLNAFGYLSVGDEPGQAGNVGGMDLVASLEWVRDNIAEFGGDPGNVTIFGQSGGGSKVSHCLIMPAARGLSHRAIIQSGGGLATGDPDQARETAERVARELGTRPDDLGALRRVPAEDLLAAAIRVRGSFGPVADGDIVPRAPFTPAAPEMSHDVPLIIGYTKDERTLYNIGLDWWGTLSDEQLLQRARDIHGDRGEALVAAYRRIHPDYSNDYIFTDITNTHAYRAPTIAERKAAAGGAPVWMFQWDWEAPVDDGILRSPHTMEIPFVFNNVDKGPLLLGSAASTKWLGYIASASWANFARTGNPNVEGLPYWPSYDATDRATMLFDIENRVVSDPLKEAREILMAEG